MGGGATSTGRSTARAGPRGVNPGIDFLLSATRDEKAARRFLRQALARDNTRNPREVVTDRLKSHPGAIRDMKREGELWRFTRHRRGRWICCVEWRPGGFRFPAEVILWAVRRYLQFPASYRDLERMLADRDVQVDHVTLYPWVQRFAPELEKRTRRHLRPCRGPWHVDKT